MKVCVLCPTSNRQNFIPLVIHQFQIQDYDPTNRILLIYDDTPGDDSELSANFFEQHECDMTNVVYIYKPDKKTIYEKRNELNRLAVEEYGAECIVCMDDDDLYLSNRISEAVRILSGGCRGNNHEKNDEVVIAGSNVLHLLFIDTGDIYEVRVDKPMYASNNTMAYTREYARTHCHNPLRPSQNNNEEDSFTNGFTEPMKQMRNVVLMLCHNHNTVDKGMFKSRKNKLIASKRDALLTSFIGDDEVKRDFYRRHFPKVLRNLKATSGAFVQGRKQPSCICRKNGC